MCNAILYFPKKNICILHRISRGSIAKKETKKQKAPEIDKALPCSYQQGELVVSQVVLLVSSFTQLH